MILEQGDVLLFRENIPKSATEIVETNILAHGEATGHAHRLDFGDDAPTSTPSKNFEVMKDPNSNVIYLRVLRPTNLRHEEHALIEVIPGDYRVGRVREKDMFSDLVAPVVD